MIDTSILCELLEVPGMCGQPARVQGEFKRRSDTGERFIVPITAVIETGNHIAQARGDRRGAAMRLDRLLRLAMSNATPFVLNATAWDESFLEGICRGDSTVASGERWKSRTA